jgi:glycosyltransferase involved in cell wall biosynthesis
MMSGNICVVPHLSGVGGMVSFHGKLTAGLESRGFEVGHDLDSPSIDTILIVGGIRHLSGLRRSRKRGTRIVQRLNGMNWVHRLRWTGLRHFLRAEYGNLLLALIRSRLADTIVYQSEFARRWWEHARGPTPVPHAVIHNGVDLDTFTSNGHHTRPENHFRLLLVEGSLMGGYEIGLEVAVELAERINATQKQKDMKLVELMVVGRVAPEVKSKWENRTSIPIVWTGLVSLERIPEIDRSAHVLYSADVNAACPNSVIEALACGLPVLAFDTGALPELVDDDAGRVVPYGGDPWKLDPPDLDALSEAAFEIINHQERYRNGARSHAEAYFSLDKMVDDYVQILYEG